MKIFQILLVIALFGFIFSTYCNQIQNPAKKKDCNDNLSEDDKAAGIKYCCYLEVDNSKACVGFTQEAYDEIGKAKKSDDNSSSKSKGKIECQSLFLKFALINLVFLFL